MHSENIFVFEGGGSSKFGGVGVHLDYCEPKVGAIAVEVTHSDGNALGRDLINGLIRIDTASNYSVMFCDAMER